MKKELKKHNTAKTGQGRKAMNLGSSYNQSTQGQFHMVDQKTETCKTAFDYHKKKQRVVTLTTGSGFRNPSHQFSQMLRTKLAESLKPIAPVKQIDPKTVQVADFASPLEKQIFILGCKIRKAKKERVYIPKEVFTALRLKKIDLLDWDINEMNNLLKKSV